MLNQTDLMIAEANCRKQIAKATISCVREHEKLIRFFVRIDKIKESHRNTMAKTLSQFYNVN